MRTRTAAKHACFPSCQYAMVSSPLGISQHVFSRDRQNIRNRALTRTAALGDWPDHLHVDRVHLEMARDANRPSQATRRDLPEWRAQSIAGICEHTAEAELAAIMRSISASAISGFVRSAQCSAGTPTRFKRAWITCPAFGKEEAQSNRHRHLATRQRQ